MYKIRFQTTGLTVPNFFMFKSTTPTDFTSGNDDMFTEIFEIVIDNSYKYLTNTVFYPQNYSITISVIVPFGVLRELDLLKNYFPKSTSCSSGKASYAGYSVYNYNQPLPINLGIAYNKTANYVPQMYFNFLDIFKSSLPNTTNYNLITDENYVEKECIPVFIETLTHENLQIYFETNIMNYLSSDTIRTLLKKSITMIYYEPCYRNAGYYYAMLVNKNSHSGSGDRNTTMWSKIVNCYFFNINNTINSIYFANGYGYYSTGLFVNTNGTITYNINNGPDQIFNYKNYVNASCNIKDNFIEGVMIKPSTFITPSEYIRLNSNISQTVTTPLDFKSSITVRDPMAPNEMLNKRTLDKYLSTSQILRRIIHT